MTEKLLEELEGDCLERLRWAVCRRLGILPGSRGWRLMTGRRVLRYACHMALDERERAARGEGDVGARRESGAAGSFDMERFRGLGGGV